MCKKIIGVNNLMKKRAAENIRLNREQIETSSSFVIVSRGVGHMGVGHKWNSVEFVISLKEFYVKSHHSQ